MRIYLFFSVTNWINNDLSTKPTHYKQPHVDISSHFPGGNVELFGCLFKSPIFLYHPDDVLRFSFSFGTTDSRRGYSSQLFRARNQISQRRTPSAEQDLVARDTFPTFQFGKFSLKDAKISPEKLGGLHNHLPSLNIPISL